MPLDRVYTALGWVDVVPVPANMLATDTAQVVNGVKTYPPGTLLMANAAGTQTAEPYSDVHPPGTLERIIQAAPAAGVNPVAGETVEWSPDGKSLWMRAPDGTDTKIGPSAGGSSSPRIELIKTADQAIQHATAAAYVDIADLSWNALANTSYELEGILWFTVAATTTGHRWGFMGPGLALANIVLEYQTSATAWATYDQQHNNTTMNAAPAMAAVTASALAAVPNVVRFKGYIRNGATAGVIKMQGASELSTASVTVLKGSNITYRAI